MAEHGLLQILSMGVIIMKKNNSERLKALLCLSMMAALAIAADVFLRIPGIGGFLSYEPKDVILTISGFIFGPIAGVILSLVVCIVEMLTVSTTGLIGLLMNFISSAVFVGVSTAFYAKKKTLPRAILGLVVGSLSMTVIMLLWNYIITPIYMSIPRAAVLELFVPLLIPFNLLKTALNSALVVFLYKGVVTALRKSKLIPETQSDAQVKKANTALIVSVSALLAVTLTLVVLLFAGILKF